MTYIGAELRRQVITRAGNCCEYCLLSQEDNFFTYHVDHVIPEKHEGETSIDNLALSCPSCNTFKGSDVGAFDRETGGLTPLFNPRTQVWEQHFRLNGAKIEALTPEGRVSVFLLRLNREDQLREREGLIKFNSYPCRALT
ncbi:MAG: HNH endonuclease [Burkholderiales bacterium]|nr:HNH endonuclease [Anaerolineae bacterium]